MVFFPNDDKLAAEAKDIVEHVVAKEGRCKITGWRDVPVDKDVVGRLAKITEPRIAQVCQLAIALTLPSLGPHLLLNLTAQASYWHGTFCIVCSLILP